MLKIVLGRASSVTSPYTLGPNRIFGFRIRNCFRTVRGKTVFGDSCDNFQIWQLYVVSISQFANDGGLNFFLCDESFQEQ